MVFVSQLDRKYIIATCMHKKHGKILVCVDQHAADERIKLENYIKQDQHKRQSLYNANNPSRFEKGMKSGMTYKMNSIEMEAIRNKGVNFFRFWGFIFDIIDDTNGDNRMFEINTVIKFYEFPVIENTAFTIDDFREFVDYIRLNKNLPQSLIVPPVLRRIYASKACRSAVKFGDELSNAECCDILKYLVMTDYPFQCAHGRPSIVPLSVLRVNDIVSQRDISTSTSSLSHMNKRRKTNHRNSYRDVLQYYNINQI